MGWNGSGGYTRTHNFSADSSANIKILASRVDEEFNDFASAITVALTKNGQNSPTANLPMGGFRHTNAGAAASAENYLRVREFVTDVPVFAVERVSSDTVLQVSVPFYVSVSANLSPPDGARLRVRAFNTKASSTCALHLYTPANVSGGGSPHVARILSQNASVYYAGTIYDGLVYNLIYEASVSAWMLMNPTWGTVKTLSATGKCYSGNTVAGTDGSPVVVNIARHGGGFLFNFSSVSVSCSVSAQYIVVSIANATAMLQSPSAGGGGMVPVMVRGLAPTAWLGSLGGQGAPYVGQAIFAASYPSIAGTTVSANSTVQMAGNTTPFF